MEQHFCNCPVTQCNKHPHNHNEGCDPCIKDNLQKGKMPTCMFRAAHDDVSEVTDYTLAGFVAHYRKHHADET